MIHSTGPPDLGMLGVGRALSVSRCTNTSVWGERSADFLVPLFSKGVPQPFPVVFAEPSDLFQDRVEHLVGFGGGT